DQLCRDYVIRSGQIEINTNCNWRCEFCPVSIDPKPREIMKSVIFEKIVRELSEIDTLKFVTFHFFNEPLLDPLFQERIACLQKFGLKLALYTNGSMVTKEVVQFLSDSGVIHDIVVNLPSLKKAEFEEITGRRHFNKSIQALNILKNSGLPFQVSVNGLPDVAKKKVQMIQSEMGLGSQVFSASTCDRSGVLSNGYFQNVHIKNRLNGCSWPVNHAYFGVDGTVFLCCNDYYKTERLGSVVNQSLEQIFSSKKAVDIRRRIFGVNVASEDHVCRKCHNQTENFSEREFLPIAHEHIAVKKFKRDDGGLRGSLI
ncbi:MAG: radical SAM/SPASM domain-containing protein, partial [Cyanobacteria bacterium J06656_5]